MALKAQVFIYAHKFDGEPKLSDFMLVEEDIANIVDGEFLAEAIFISVDPYQRTLIVQFPVGTVMVGRQVAR